MRFSKLPLVPMLAGALALGACAGEEAEVEEGVFGEEEMMAPVAEPAIAPPVAPMEGAAFDPALDVNADGILGEDEGLGDMDADGILDRDEAYVP